MFKLRKESQILCRSKEFQGSVTEKQIGILPQLGLGFFCGWLYEMGEIMSQKKTKPVLCTFGKEQSFNYVETNCCEWTPSRLGYVD